MVSVWNKGTFPRIKALKDCKFLRGLIENKDSELARAKHIHHAKLTQVTEVSGKSCRKHLLGRHGQLAEWLQSWFLHVARYELQRGLTRYLRPPP